MGVFNYLFNISFEQKKQDWKEYKRLRTYLNWMWEIEHSGYIGLRYNCDEKESIKNIKNKCVARSVECCDPDFPQIDGATIVTKYCKYFSPAGVCCNQMDCPSIKENHFYADAYQKRVALEKQLKTFWKDKFKQKNK